MSCLWIQLYFVKPASRSSFCAACALTVMQSVRSGRLNECLVLEEFLQGTVSMAEVMFFMLLFLNCGSADLVSTRPADATFTTTVSAAGNARTPNTTGIPTSGFTSSYSHSTTNKPLAERPGKTAERAVPRKKAEEEEGPVEFGEWLKDIILHFKCGNFKSSCLIISVGRSVITFKTDF